MNPGSPNFRVGLWAVLHASSSLGGPPGNPSYGAHSRVRRLRPELQSRVRGRLRLRVPSFGQTSGVLALQSFQTSGSGVCNVLFVTIGYVVSLRCLRWAFSSPPPLRASGQ
eukprot:8301485-Alexandrium_andersonii.AAC.1